MHLNQIQNIITNSEQVLKGKSKEVKIVVCNILAGGHTLIEDTPGVGKTTLVKYLGKSLGVTLSRIQFTNDLLPADILGATIYNKNSANFEFHPGPIFGELILADELNRAPPKTQSALLQAMEEKQITIEGKTHNLPDHFTVIATQNPNAQIGTYGLPESQLDRFSCKLKMGYPNKESTIELLKATESSIDRQNIKQFITTEELKQTQTFIKNFHVEDAIYELVYKLLDYSRNQTELLPLSNRCGLDIIRLSKAWAYLHDREYIIPDDIYTIFPYTAGHRLVHPENADIALEHSTAQSILQQI